MKLGNRLSNKICPDNMTIEEWQVALRRENARESNFSVEHLDKNRIWGDYLVCSDTGRYKVAFRGVQSDRNFCSCLDFRTNGLGTCKHLEAVSLFLQEHVPGYPWAGLSYAAEYSSMFVSYKGGRSIRIRIGDAYRNEYERLKEKYFTEDGVLPEANFHLLDQISQEAVNISPSFRCYDDVQEFVTEQLNLKQWQNELRSAYPEQAIPWDKKALSPAYKEVESLLYELCFNGYGFIIGVKHPFYIHLIARLTEEIYQGEEVRDKGYIIVNSDTDVLVWQSILFQYSEYIHLPVQVLSQQQFLKHQTTLGEKATFVYINDADCLKEWKNPLSLAIKRLEIKHLYLHVEALKSFTPVQLSSILQHINPFIIGPFYKFIHTYRPMFPLQEYRNLLPPEMRLFTHFVTRVLLKAHILPSADNTAPQLPIEELLTPTDRVNKFLSLLGDILADSEASELLRERIKALLDPC